MAAEDTIKALLAEALGLEPRRLNSRKSFLALGGDSLSAIAFIAKCRSHAIDIEFADILNSTSAASLIALVVKKGQHGANASGTTCLPVNGYGQAPAAVTSNKSVPSSRFNNTGLSEEISSLGNIQDIGPCSTMQESFLISQKINPGAYTCRFEVRITSCLPDVPISVDVVAGCWEKVVQRHSTLRTNFKESEHRPGHLDQVVWSHILPRITRCQDGSEAWEGISRVDLNDLHIPHHVYLKQIASGQILLRLDISHALVDGQSAEVLLRDLCAAYRGGLPGTETLANLDFVRFQQGLPVEAARAYWSQHLADVQGSFLPTTAETLQPSEPQMLQKKLSLSQDLLETFCGKHNITVATVCQLAWGLVLRCFTNSPDVCFSYVTSGRQARLSGISEAAGLFINTLPCRMSLDSLSTPAELLRSLHGDFLQGMPFHNVTLPGSARHWGNSILSFHRGLPESSGADLVFEVLGRSTPTDYDVTLNIDIQRSSISSNMEFCKSRINADDAENMLSLFQRGIEFVLSCTDLPLESFPPITAEDRGRLVRQTETIAPRSPQCLHEVVREVGLRRPQAPAVCAWDCSLTFQELDMAASRLASYLVTLGVGPEQSVGICMDKSAWVIVAILAVLKAGGVVVPLGVEQPLARIRSIVASAATTIMLTDAQQAKQLHGIVPHLVTVNASLLAQLPDYLTASAVCPTVTADNAAWIVFTSGSTGLPKGSILEHVNLNTSIACHGPWLGFGPHTRTFQFSAHTFDVAIQDFMTTLCFGGCICIPSEYDRRNNLIRTMNELQVNFAALTPTVASLITPAEVPYLRTLVLVGEVGRPAVIKSWMPHATVFNGYGPSECSIYNAITKPIENEQQAQEIGHAVGCCFWIVDSDNYNRLSPAGAPGELLIEGPHLGRGYLHETEQTAKAFVTDPEFVRELKLSPGRRMYRSGDIVKMAKGGAVTFLSRRDTQIKVNGQRVEIGEVEHHIQSHPAVQHAIVVYVRDVAQTSRLVAAATLRGFTSGPGSGPDLEELQETDRAAAMLVMNDVRNNLYQHVMQYMIPSYWVPLKTLPVNASAKIDRRRLERWISQQDLEALNASQSVASDVGNHLATTTERHIREVWSEALGIPADQIPYHRSFLSLGGDSITAMKVGSGCRKIGIKVDVREVLQCQAIPDLALEATKTLEDQEQSLQLTSMQRKANLSVADIVYLQKECLPGAGITNWEDVEDVLPCSPVQQGVLLSHLRNPQTYRLRQLCRVRSTGNAGSIDIDRLTEAWRRIQNRHSILRTVFVESLPDQEGFYQVVLKSVEPDIVIVHCEKENDAENLVIEQPALAVFGSRPAHRFIAITTATEDIYCRFEISHALVDAVSVDLLARDLLEAYEHSLPAERGPQYSDYVSFLQVQSSDADLLYWKTLLAGVEPCCLPPLGSTTDLVPREQEVKAKMKTRITDLSSVHRFRNTYGVTMASIFQLSWALVLAEHTGSSKVSFGYPSSGRDLPIPDAHSIVGPMINMLICFTKIDYKVTVLDTLRTIQEQVLESSRHQRSSLASIQHGLGLSQDVIFNTTLSYERRSEAGLRHGQSIALEKITGDGVTEYPVGIHVAVSEEDIDLTLNYSTCVLSAASADRLLKSFLQTVEFLVRDGSSQLGDVQTLPVCDVTNFQSWNHNTPPRLPICVHELVQESALRQPCAPAIDAWDGTLTYSELQAAASRVAHHLVGLGIRSDEDGMVGLCMSKSKWSMIAILAILQSGGVVVPIGISDPTSRIGTIIGQANAKVVLTDSRQQAERLHDLAPHIIVVDERLLGSLPYRGDKRACETVTPGNLAWLIFTSGSTGLPKGVMLEHGAISTIVQSQARWVGAGPHTRRLQFAAFTFDVSLADIFTTLGSGGCVCVPSEDERLNDLAGTINARGVNLAQLTSTVAEMLDPAKTSIEQLILGGELVTPPVFKSWLGHAEVRTAYGPAECTITASHSQPHNDERLYQNIGFPLASNFWITHANDSDRLCPIGVVGELLIEAPTLARGYLHDPEKTATSFVVDPAFVKKLAMSTGRRMYKTGDLAKFNLDGSLDIIGRRDAQIKIRGQRVETGEIETWIKKLLNGVRAVVVDVIRHDDQLILFAAVQLIPDHNDEQKTACSPVLHEPSKSLSEAFTNLRNELLLVLPAYMVPSAYVPMAQLPLNNSGKQDRRSVRELVERLDSQILARYLSSNTTKDEPSTELERRLHSIWTAVLNRPYYTIGANDDFFQAGGDSVTAMRMVAAGRKMLLRMTVADVFRYPRMSDLAHHLEGQMDVDDEEDVAAFALLNGGVDAKRLNDLAAQCEVASIQIEDVYPCTPLQEGMMAITAQRPSAYTLQRVFRLVGHINTADFRAVWEKLVSYLPILRTRILPIANSSAVQVVIKEAIQWHDSPSLQGYLTKDRETPMAYGTPLCRLAIVAERSERFLVWTMHHSIYDGWSSIKMFDLLQRLTKGEPVPKAVALSRFANYLIKQDLEASQAFWRQQLEGVAMNKFPILPDSSCQPHPAQKIEYRMERSRVAGTVTTAIVLRAAWAMILAAHTGADETVTNVVLSGRNAAVPGILDLVGPTVTTVPLRIPVTRGRTVMDFLLQVQQQATDMMPYEHSGLQNIRRWVPGLGADFDPGHTFTVQASLGEEDLESGGLYKVIGMERQSVLGNTFHSYPLIIECTTDLDNHAVTVRAFFDDAVMSIAQVKLLLYQFEHVFHQLLTENEGSVGHEKPARLLRDVSLVSPADIAIMQSMKFNVPAKSDDCIHEAVRRMTSQQPDAPAICAWDGNLSYGELDAAASKLAHHLVFSFGIGPGVIVGLCMNKSKNAVIAILAILQAGGVVVPLGVQHPVLRIQSIVEDTAATVVLADEQQASRLRGSVEHLLVVDASLIAHLPTNVGRPCPAVTPDSPAWIIFTSGSTGKPKGVVLEHHAMSTIVEAQGRLTETGTHTRRLQFAAYTFDVSIGDTFTTLSYGGCLCVPSEEDRMSNLTSVINDMDVNFLYLTSTVAGLLSPVDVPSVKVITLGGEPVSPTVLGKWLPYVTIRNAYGPAECTITAFHTPPLSNQRQAPFVGYPLASRPWVVAVDDFNRLVPIGAPGELLIEGPTLSPGYFEDDEKTNAAFITDPMFVRTPGLGPHTGRRMYRTGDILRQNTDGSLMILGRRDTQIKIRGQRVETSEIEGWILRLAPDVRVAYVDVIKRGPNQSHDVLMAAIDLAGKSEPLTLLQPEESRRKAIRQLQGLLSGVLPPFMVPSVYIPVSRLPLNASCKLDRMAIRTFLAALPATELSRHTLYTSSTKTVATPTEAVLRRLWSTNLGIDESNIGRDDNLFYLGGDSIVAMNLIAGARAEGLRLVVADVFKHPVLADMALFAKQENQVLQSTAPRHEPFSLLHAKDVDRSLNDFLCPMTESLREDIVDAFPVTDFQAQTVASNLSNARMELNYIAWSGDGRHDVGLLKEACMQLIEEMECLRTVFVFDPECDRMLQVVLRSCERNMVKTYVTSDALDAFSRKLMHADMYRPLRMGRPLLDIAIITSKSTNEHCMLFRLSHALYGGPTLPIIWNALQSLYMKRPLENHPPFSGYIADIQAQISRKHFDYWRTLLRGSSMPQFGAFTSHPRRSPSLIRTLEPCKIHIQCDLPTGVTAAMVIKAAWALVLSKHTTKFDVVFADGVSGRDAAHPAVSNAVGCAVSGMPFRVTVEPQQSMAELLLSIRDQQLQSSKYAALGFRQIFQECTDWPRGTNFTSYVNHTQQHLDTYTLGDNVYTPRFVPSNEEQSLLDVTITSQWIQNPNDTEITLRYATDSISHEVAKDLMSGLYTTITSIQTNLHANVLQVLGSLQLQTHETLEEVSVPSDEAQGIHLSMTEPISSVWASLLQERKPAPPSSLTKRPDWIDAARVAVILQQEGVPVSVERAYLTLLSSAV